MSDSLIDYSRLGWNIKCLRESNNETLEDLMHAIGASSTGTISGYESGSRKPSRDTLLNIAKHFSITENELIYGDFNYLNSISTSNIQVNDAISILKYLLPIVTSPSAEEHSAFTYAYKTHTDIFLLFIQGKSFCSNLPEHCVKLYTIADSDGIPEATANLLWWLLFEGIMIRGITPYLLNNRGNLNFKNLHLGNYIKTHYLWKVENSDDDDAKIIEESRTEYIKEVDPEYARLLKKLKFSSIYSDLADYYSALRYFYGLVDNGLTYEMNSIIGKQMLSALETLGNQYVNDFYCGTADALHLFSHSESDFFSDK